MTTGSIFWFVIFAGSGGVLVLVGLLMEFFSEREWYKNTCDFRRCKSGKVWGEWLVIFGIVVEIVVAAWTAKDEWQTRQMAIADNPLNQPIANVTATASIHVKGTNFLNIADIDKFPNNHSVSLSFMRSGQDTWKLHLICKLSERMGNEDSTWWHLEFGGETEAPSWNLRATDSVRSADDWNIVWLDVPVIRSDTEVLGGEVRLVINDAIKKTLPIPPQRPEPLFGIAYKDIPAMEGTTTNNVNVRVVGTP